MGALSILGTIYGQGNIRLWGTLLSLFFIIGCALSGFLICRAIFKKPQLQITKNEIIIPALFGKKDTIIDKNNLVAVQERRVPALVEIIYATQTGANKREVIWADMCRSRQDYQEAAKLIQAIPLKKLSIDS